VVRSVMAWVQCPACSSVICNTSRIGRSVGRSSHRWHVHDESGLHGALMRMSPKSAEVLDWHRAKASW
jgi:hypothetical protein